jgi:hypothetical protein
LNTKGCNNSDLIVFASMKLFRNYVVETPFVMFVHRRKDAETVGELLNSQLDIGQIRWVHGGLKVGERAEVAADMKDGKLAGVVCTDVWATGVDIPNLKTVVMACGGSAPIGLKQRAGRGARLFGAKEEFLIYDLELKAADPHIQKRIKGYEAGGFTIEGSPATKPHVARAEVPDDPMLEALFNRVKETQTAVEPEPELSTWELMRNAHVEANNWFAPYFIVVLLLAIFCSI